MSAISPTELVWRAALALGGKKALGEVLGFSARTMYRWGKGRAFDARQAAKVARALAQKDRALAEQLAAHAGTTLADLDVPDAFDAELRIRHAVDSVLCAAAETLGAAPGAMRPALYAGFQRALAMNLTLRDVVAGLAPLAPKGGARRT
jgi:hypothetical protein